MYIDYYELEAEPFRISSDPRFLWIGDMYKEALATLRYGIMDNSGFLLLTGEVGSGKTLLINRLVSMLNVGTAVAIIPDPDLVSMDFYKLLADDFQMNRSFSTKGEFLIHLRDFLHKSYADHKQVLLVIDDSQRLNDQIMEDIRVLSNIELHDQKLINIFFVGGQEFNNLLMTPENKTLSQQITIRYHINPLNLDETEQYIYHRLKIVGGKRPLFERAALSDIYSLSGGVPRLINIICDRALLAGFSQGKKEIDSTIIQGCAEDIWVQQKQTSGGKALFIAAPKKAQQTDDKEGNPHIIEALPSQFESKADLDAHSLFRNEKGPQSSFAWKIVFVIVVVLSLGLVVFTISQFSRNQGPRWNVEELTPKKYFTDLEKELLVSRLENNIENEHNANSQKTTVYSQEKNEPSESVSVMAGPITSSTSLNEGGIVPLPLIKEKIVIHFSLNSNEIETESFAELNRIANYLKNHPNEIVYVLGFTDSVESESYSESVSGFRANTVKSFLLGKGATAENIKVFAMGDSSPLASNDTPTGRLQNRRVEIEFSPID